MLILRKSILFGLTSLILFGSMPASALSCVAGVVMAAGAVPTLPTEVMAEEAMAAAIVIEGGMLAGPAATGTEVAGDMTTD